MVREYVNASGYKIRVSETAYNLLYKKNGFVPYTPAASAGETAAAQPVVQTDNTALPESAAPDKKPERPAKGKKKPAPKATVADTPDQEQDTLEKIAEDVPTQEPPEKTTSNIPSQADQENADMTAADQDAAEQSEEK